MYPPLSLPTPPPVLQERDVTVLPLTTVFTPPKSCFDDPFTIWTSDSGVAGFSSAWKDYFETSSQCYPPSFSTLQYNWNWYSPGVCASGYEVAQTSKASGDVTQVWCCPSSFTITGFISTNVTYQACSSLGSHTGLIGAISSVVETFSPTYSFVALQWPMSVEYASSDLSVFSPASAPLLDQATTTIASFTGTVITDGSRPTETTASARIPQATASATQIAVDSGLSTGAKAGIGVGAAIAALAVLAAIIIWLYRRRNTRQRIPDEPTRDTRAFYVDNKVELPTEATQQAPHMSPVELDALGSPQELSGQEGGTGKPKKQQSPVELEGNWHGNATSGYRVVRGLHTDGWNPWEVAN